MGRQKKNELDAILEQLKRSYAADPDAELEDSLLEEEKSDEDAELVSNSKIHQKTPRHCLKTVPRCFYSVMPK